MHIFSDVLFGNVCLSSTMIWRKVTGNGWFPILYQLTSACPNLRSQSIWQIGISTDFWNDLGYKPVGYHAVLRRTACFLRCVRWWHVGLPVWNDWASNKLFILEFAINDIKLMKKGHYIKVSIWCSWIQLKSPVICDILVMFDSSFFLLNDNMCFRFTLKYSTSQVWTSIQFTQCQRRNPGEYWEICNTNQVTTYTIQTKKQTLLEYTIVDVLYFYFLTVMKT